MTTRSSSASFALKHSLNGSNKQIKSLTLYSYPNDILTPVIAISLSSRAHLTKRREQRELVYNYNPTIDHKYDHNLNQSPNLALTLTPFLTLIDYVYPPELAHRPSLGYSSKN